MSETKQGPSVARTENRPDAQAIMRQLFAGRPGDLEGVMEEQNLNLRYINRVNEVALRGAHHLLARQNAAMREMFDDLTMLMKNATSKDSPTALAEASYDGLQYSISRGVEHMRIMFDWAHEMNQSTWSLLKERLDTSLEQAKQEQDKKTSGK